MNNLVLGLPVEFTGIANVLQLDAQLLGDYSVKAVNGRHLQEVLETTKDHTDWAKYQIERLNLVEGIDFEKLNLPNEGVVKTGPIPITYCFTILVAQDIALMSQAKNGQLVRDYFKWMKTQAEKAMRGEPIPLLNKAPLTKSEEAVREWQSISNMTLHVMRDLLGYSQGALRRTAIEIGVDIEIKTLEKVLPNELKYDPEAGIPVSMDNHLGSHAALKKLGNKGWNVTTMAESFGNGCVPKDINDALCELGMQVQINASTPRNGYTPTDKAKDLCNVEERASGSYKGREVVKNWMYLELLPHLTPILNRIISQRISALPPKKR
jgi:phage anti-repressor protein